MEYLRDRLLRETVKFLEVCQSFAMEGKMGQKEYFLLSNTKFQFIKHVLEVERKRIFIDKGFRERINRLFIIDDSIYSLDNKGVG